MFDLSFTEILLVLVVAIVFLGPEDLPKVAKTLAKVARSIRYIGGEVRRAIDDVIQADDVMSPPKSAPRKFILDDQGNYREIYDLDDFLPENRQVITHEKNPPLPEEVKDSPNNG